MKRFADNCIKDNTNYLITISLNLLFKMKGLNVLIALILCQGNLNFSLHNSKGNTKIEIAVLNIFSDQLFIIIMLYKTTNINKLYCHN